MGTFPQIKIPGYGRGPFVRGYAMLNEIIAIEGKAGYYRVVHGSRARDGGHPVLQVKRIPKAQAEAEIAAEAIVRAADRHTLEEAREASEILARHKRYHWGL